MDKKFTKKKVLWVKNPFSFIYAKLESLLIQYSLVVLPKKKKKKT